MVSCVGSLFVLACRAPETARPVGSTRTDSAGITIVTNIGSDVIREFPSRHDRFLRDSSGERMRYTSRADQWVRVSEDGRIFLLNLDDGVVNEFDSTGAHVRNFGRRGGGPGELLRPLSLMLRHDTLMVADEGKGAVVKWSLADGRVIPEVSFLSLGMTTSKVLDVAGGRALVVADRIDTQPPRAVFTWTGAERAIADEPIPTPRAIKLPCSPRPRARFPLLTPRFFVAHDGNWSVATSSRQLEYVMDHPGASPSIVRRLVPTRATTKEDAIVAAGRGYRLTMNGVRCELSPAELVKAVGVADSMPAIHAAAVLADGSVWLQRTPDRRIPAMVDQFDSTGRYVATWKNGIVPCGVLPDGRLVVEFADPVDGGTLIRLVSLPRA